jgi:hypothetical protein
MKPVHFILLTLLLQAAAAQAQNVNVTIQNSANGTPVSTGLVSLYDLTSATLLLDRVGSGTSILLDPSHQYRASTDQERFEHAAAWLKHHAWDGDPQKYLLKHQFDIPPGQQQIFKTADFTNARKTTLFNNFEEFTDEGEVRFRDPWYYVNAEHEQPDALLPFTSPYIPTGAYDKSEPAVLLGKTVQATFPFYSLKFHSFLQSNYETPTSSALTGDDWVFVGAFARNAGDVELAGDFH